jgi:hypothetical protein
MPVPKPKADESEKDFIARCEKFMHEENNSKPESEKRSNEQLTAFAIQLGARANAEKTLN